MKKLFGINEHGTITYLRGLISKKPEQHILFPEQKVVIHEKEKLRGGAPVCCPIFGTTPIDNKYYSGIQLPLHGLMQTSSESSRVTSREGKVTSFFQFETPWRHTVIVSGDVTHKPQFEHELYILYHDFTKPNYAFMPLSVAFHPYIATGGKPFSIKYGASFFVTSEQIICEECLFVQGTGNYTDTLRLTFSDYTIQFCIQGLYSHFCIWTDDIEKYICVKPFCGVHFSEPYLLYNFQMCQGKCALEVI